MKICRVTVERARVLHQGPYVSAIGTVNLFIGDEEVGGGKEACGHWGLRPCSVVVSPANRHELVGLITGDPSGQTSLIIF